MKASYALEQGTSEKELNFISKHIRICVICGNTDVEEYEFGISCELCGNSFYFGKKELTEVN